MIQGSKENKTKKNELIKERSFKSRSESYIKTIVDEAFKLINH